MKLLKTPLFKGNVVNRWLVSDISEEKVKFDPVTLNGSVADWLHSAAFENPCKTKFVKEKRKEGSPVITTGELAPGNMVSWNGKSQKLKVWFPFDDINIDLSYFWSTPTYLSSFATTVIISDEKKTVPFELFTCGGAAVWLNETKIIKFDPYTRNVASSTKIELPLVKGENRIDIFFEDLAERDTSFQFRLVCLQENELLQGVPVGNNDPEQISRAEDAMKTLAFTRNHYLLGNVVLRCENPYQGEDFEVYLKGATEEQEKLGIFFEKLAVFKAGKNNTVLAEVEDMPFGFLRFWAETKVGDIAIGRTITVESFPVSLVPEAKPTIEERKQQCLEFLAKYGESNANQAIAMLYTGGEQAEIEKILYRQLEFINDRNDCSDFYLVLFPHLLYKFGTEEYLSAELLEACKKCILNFRYWIDEPGDDVMWFYSENHALLFHICQLLAGEMYPDEVFTCSGLTGVQAQKKATALLENWFQTFFEEGFSEWNSSAYLPIDSLGFACLYERTENETLKKYAKQGLDYIFYCMTIFGKDGYLASTSGRTYLKEQMGNYSNCTSAMAYVGYGKGNLGHAGKGVLPLCFGGYTPPSNYLDYVNIPKEKALMYRSTQGQNGLVDLYNFKTDGFALSTAANYRVGERGFQENPIQLTFSPTAQIWVNQPGEFALYGSGRPSYWAGNECMPRVNQYQGFVSIVYNTPKSYPVDFTHVYFPTMEFHVCRLQENRIFAEIDGYYCMVYSQNGLAPVQKTSNVDREFIAQGYKNVWIIRASGKYEFATLDDFVNQMLKTEVVIDEEQNFSIQDSIYGKLEGGWNQSLQVNGNKVEYKGFGKKGVLEEISL